MWPFTVKCRCPRCAGAGKARYATCTVTKEFRCLTCSGTGEVHRVEEIREDVVNAFGFKTGTRRVGTRSRIDPCAACGARGKVTRTEHRRIEVGAEGDHPGAAEVVEGDCQACRGKGVLVEGQGTHVRCWECAGLGIYWGPVLRGVLAECRLCQGTGLVDTGDYSAIVFGRQPKGYPADRPGRE